jgi:hypothetical protein
MKLFGRKKEDEADSSKLAALVRDKMAAAEEAFSSYTERHLQTLHQPGGYALEKKQQDFMDLGMRKAYLEALDEVELSVDGRTAFAMTGGRHRGSAQVVTRWTVRGVHNRPLLGLAPSGDRVTISGVTYTRFRDYRIKTEYTFWEMPELTRRMVDR